MNRSVLTLILFLALAPTACAQDMPLSQILSDNEGWKKAEGSPPKTASSSPTTTSPDGSTTFRWNSGYFIEARQTKAKEDVPFAPYCPLRVGLGTAPSVTAMTTDKDGRIYAATPIGIQVYDPTGRLCGVLQVPEGAVHTLLFEGNLLVAWVGETKHVRKLKTTGSAK